MEYTKCELCNSDDASLLFLARDNGCPSGTETFNIVKCNKCFFVYTNPRPDRVEIGRYYPPSYYGKDNVRFNRIIELAIGLTRKGRARDIASLMPPGRILDIGCGRGKMLFFLRKKGWQVTGTEVSEAASRFAREYLNLEVIPRDLNEIKFPDAYFNTITLFNSLEHLPNPKEVLTKCKRILKPDGWLIIEVPNINSIQARIFKDSWFHLDAPRHYCHFSYSTLKEMLNTAGFEVYGLKNFSLEFGPYGALQSLMNRIGLPCNLLYSVFRSKTARLKDDRTIGYYLRLLITIFTLPFFAVMGTVISLVESVLRKGGMIKVYARQKRKDTSDE